MTAGEAARLTALELQEAAGDESLREARILVCALMDVPLSAFPMHHGMELQKEQLTILWDWTERRKKREPIQYLLVEWSFFGYDFIVNPAVLIPRPETEELAERAIRRIQERGLRTVLDLCTGSGCLAIVIKKETGAEVTATDVSRAALDTAAENAKLNEAEIEFMEGDLFQPVFGRRFDCIVTNPPYLSETDMGELQPELCYEPRNALYGGRDGLDFYRRIAREYRDYLNPGGTLLMEIGADEGDAVLDLMPGAALYRDLSGNARIVSAEA